jgi:hypothetical protein
VKYPEYDPEITNKFAKAEGPVMRMNPPTLDPDIYDPNAYHKVPDELPRMYISSPTFGIAPEVRRESFALGSMFARRFGFVPVCPPYLQPDPHDGPCPPGRRTEGSAHAEACHFKADIRGLLTCSAILLMDGWTISWGCKLEMQLASLFGMHVYVPGTHDNKMELRLLS